MKRRFTEHTAEREIAPPTRRAAYHDGPPEIHFAGRAWVRGVAQPVTDDDWAAIQARGDVGDFAFRLED